MLSAQTYTFSNQTFAFDSTDSTTSGTSVDPSVSTIPVSSTLTTVSVMQQYTAVRYFPGVVAGVAIIALAAFAQTVANRVQTEFNKELNKPELVDPQERIISMAGHIHVQSVDAKSSVNFKDNSYTTWSGLPMSRVLLAVLSAQAIIFLLAFLACTIVGLMESTTVLKSLPKDSVYGLVLGIVALQAFSIAPSGVLALFITIQIIITTSLFGYLCCARCYPVPVYVDWEKQCAATKRLVIYRGDELFD
ncbi:hypothetical protein RvY_12839 [Ramazzottius varieornatus]|uniref:Uncharacterized protein n=1 Tax=Ramazzottius varieornatus TaxID=947166 RepID=A0A1D1VR93_RAMVA|nr:hypothetical protein RvY_12839 [Ramazzottius varieornatus]